MDHGVDRFERLRAIVEDGEAAYLEFERRRDAEGLVDFVITDLNRAGAQLFAMPRAELLGRGLLQMFPNDRVRHLLGEFEEVHVSGRAATLERQVQDPSRAGWFSYRVIPTREGVALFVRPIGDRKQAEARQAELQEHLRHKQKMESLGRLAGGIAHDFNNLLTPILAYTQLALDQVVEGGPLWEELTEIRNAADRAGALVRDILTFGRKRLSHVVPVSLNDVVVGFGRMLRRLVGDEVELHFALAADLGNALCDPMQLEQVLTNLTVNARDAIAGEGRIRVCTENMAVGSEPPEGRRPPVPPGRYVVLAVEDTGAGIDPELLGRVFEPFFTTKDHEKGTGLGLSIVYNLVTQNGGYVGCESELGRGTRFCVYLPRTDEEAPPDEAAGPGSDAAVVGEGATILLVEDDDAVRRLARQVLAGQGFRVLEADGGPAALGLVESGAAFDLLLTDIIMPKMDGHQLRDRVAGLRPGLRVVFMSGFTAAEVEHEKVLAKPFSASALLAAVREALQS